MSSSRVNENAEKPDKYLFSTTGRKLIRCSVCRCNIKRTKFPDHMLKKHGLVKRRQPNELGVLRSDPSFPDVSSASGEEIAPYVEPDCAARHSEASKRPVTAGLDGVVQSSPQNGHELDPCVDSSDVYQHKPVASAVPSKDSSSPSDVDVASIELRESENAVVIQGVLDITNEALSDSSAPSLSHSINSRSPRPAQAEAFPEQEDVDDFVVPEAELNSFEMIADNIEHVTRGLEKFDLDSSSEHGSETASRDSNSIFGSALPQQGYSAEDVFSNVKEVVLASGGGSARLAHDSLAMVAITSHAVAAQMTLQPPNALSKTISRIYSDAAIWTSRLFKYRSASSFFHEDSREGLLRISRMLMHSKYPEYKTKGFEAIIDSPPVIYVSSASRIGIGQYVCSQLGLPSTCLTVVPTKSLTTTDGDATVDHAVDLTCLEEEIKKDEAAKRTPLIVLAYAGTPALGHVDDLVSCLEICRKYGLWLHVEGSCLAALPLSSSTNVTVESFADSISVSPSSWLRIPALPNVTLYRLLDAKVVQASGLNSVNMLLKLACLPLWTTLANAGINGVVERLRVPFRFILELVSRLKEMPQLRVLSPASIGNDFTADLDSILSRPLGIQSLFTKLVPAVTFKYVPVAGEMKHNDAYCDNFNSWLAQILKKDYGNAHNLLIDALHSEDVGVALQFMPFDYAHRFGDSGDPPLPENDEISASVENFCDHLQQQLLVLDATVGHREKFLAVVKLSRRFQVVDVKGWAGLGAVRYIPKKFLTSGKSLAASENGDEILELNEDGEVLMTRKLCDLLDAERQEIEKLNIELVVQLRGTDPAFSKGTGDDGLVCVRFGMVMDGADVDELVDVVLQTAEDIEDSSQFVESMADVVRQGIVAAETALKKENEEKIWQEGILRHVPLVGSVYNWLSPPPKEAGIKGRTFHLDAGVIESTENIYKYHMQLNLGEKVKSAKIDSPKERKTSVAEQFETKPKVEVEPETQEA
ncbi:unnamed protein product [Notodromas monacha]|uniref:Pyridoxal-dependent decarboxylase domain-containing protein 1 n=1 Tax=Notodromas monacha TaxID=399045 RepID=A0A7R9GF11_9CRUS|nr:unnamed protein product [Notodromas monacha]CAG0920201.1 unnamed protein product [Notodromas monacha]